MEAAATGRADVTGDAVGAPGAPAPRDADPELSTELSGEISTELSTELSGGRHVGVVATQERTSNAVSPGPVQRGNVRTAGTASTAQVRGGTAPAPPSTAPVSPHSRR